MNKWLLVIVIIIAAFFRLYNITNLPPGFYPDEAIYANNGVEAWETGNFKIFYLENNGREGLWPNIIGFFIVKFGYEPWVSRSVAAVFGILTVLGVYLLTKELFCENQKSKIKNQNDNLKFKINGKIALLSAFLMATSFWHILFSRIGFRAIMAPMFLVWGIYFLLLSLRKYTFKPAVLFEKNVSEAERAGFFDEVEKSEAESQAASERLGERDRDFSKIKPLAISILGGIFYGLGFHSYIAYRATPLLILIILLFYWFQNKEWQIRRKILLSTFYFLLFTFIVAASLGLYFLKNPQDFLGRTSQISIFNSPSPIKDLSINILKTVGMFNFSGDFNWRHNYAGRPLLFWPVGILFLIGIFLGLRMFFEKVSRRLSGHGFAEGKERSRESSGISPVGRNDRGFQKEYSQAFIILCAWLIITALPVVISNEGQPHALRAILMAPAIFILAGMGGAWLYEMIFTKIQNNTKLRKIFFAACFLLLLILFVEAYNTYFIKWGQNPNVQGAFSADYVEIGRELNALPKEFPKYVVVEASGVDVRGIPMPAQTIMFITDTFTPEKQKEKNIFYVLPDKAAQIPKNDYVVIVK